MGYTGSNLWRDTIAFIAHDDNTVGGKWLVVDVFAVELGTVDRGVGGHRIQVSQKININYVHARNASHRSLNDLRVPGVDSIFATDYLINAEPVSQTDDSAQIAWVLDAVEGQ